MNQQITPFKATHPGEVLKDELKAREIRQKDFATDIGMQPTMLNEILKGKRPVTADFAILLEETLDIPADFWMQFQSQYELDRARIREKNMKKIQQLQFWNLIKKTVPVRFFSKAGMLGSDLHENIHTIKKVYRINKIDELENKIANDSSFAFAYYRKSEKLQVDKNNLIGWTNLVSYKADKEKVGKFDSSQFHELKNQLHPIIYSNQNTREVVREVLSSFGIKLVYQEKFEKTPVDGYTFWSEENPAIAMTLRHKRIDNYAFTLFHELGHVYLHLSNNQDLRFLDFEKAKQKDIPASEKEANDFAREALIPENQWKAFIQSTPLDDEAILDFSKKHQMHPAIPLGRLLYEQNNYAVTTSIDRRLR